MSVRKTRSKERGAHLDGELEPFSVEPCLRTTERSRQHDRPRVERNSTHTHIKIDLVPQPALLLREPAPVAPKVLLPLPRADRLAREPLDVLLLVRVEHLNAADDPLEVVQEVGPLVVRDARVKVVGVLAELVGDVQPLRLAQAVDVVPPEVVGETLALAQVLKVARRLAVQSAGDERLGVDGPALWRRRRQRRRSNAWLVSTAHRSDESTKKKKALESGQ